MIRILLLLLGTISAAKHEQRNAARYQAQDFDDTSVLDPDPAAPTAGDVLDVFCPMGQELAAAVDRFEQSTREPIDIKRLKDDVYAACIPLWTWVAYWAAEYREGNAISEVPGEIARLKLWQRYVGPTWQTMATALSQLPVALAASPDALHQAARRVAVAVGESLEYIGFRHQDSATLNELFHIARQDFPSARE